MGYRESGIDRHRISQASSAADGVDLRRHAVRIHPSFPAVPDADRCARRLFGREAVVHSTDRCGIRTLLRPCLQAHWVRADAAIGLDSPATVDERRSFLSLIVLRRLPAEHQDEHGKEDD